jgi:predicted dehydrogenase
MSKQALSRRGFLATGAAALTGAAATVGHARIPGANDRLSIGIIGAGDRCGAHMEEIHNLSEKHNCEITAICDVWRPNRERAAARVKQWWGREARPFTKFDELLALKDIDAVVIAVPDFAHAPALVAALKADKDVYVEKPMTIEVAGANEALDLARARNRVVQAGTQYRSHGGYRAAAREIAAGAIGPVNRLTAAANFNEQRWARSMADCKEADVDWKAYLLHLTDRSFDPALLRRWHLYRDTSNGLAGLWMSHYVDAVHILTGAKYPASAVANGGTFVWRDGRQHTDTYHAILAYPEGFLFDWGMSLGNSAGNFFTVHGTRGTLEVSREYVEPTSLTISGDGGSGKEKIEPRKVAPEPSVSHIANWLDCIRSRQRPNADIQFGHQHAIATIMAAEALHTGRRQIYDPEKREVRAG